MLLPLPVKIGEIDPALLAKVKDSIPTVRLDDVLPNVGFRRVEVKAGAYTRDRGDGIQSDFDSMIRALVAMARAAEPNKTSIYDVTARRQILDPSEYRIDPIWHNDPLRFIVSHGDLRTEFLHGDLPNISLAWGVVGACLSRPDFFSEFGGKLQVYTPNEGDVLMMDQTNVHRSAINNTGLVQDTMLLAAHPRNP